MEYLYGKHGFDDLRAVWVPGPGFEDIEPVVRELWQHPEGRYEAIELLVSKRLTREQIAEDPLLCTSFHEDDHMVAAGPLLFRSFEESCEAPEAVMKSGVLEQAIDSLLDKPEPVAAEPEQAVTESRGRLVKILYDTVMGRRKQS
jgi:hypothetical protein